MIHKKSGNQALTDLIPYFFMSQSGTRTRDLLITNELLYQLSYFGFISNALLGKSDANLLLSLKLQNEFGIFFHSTGVFYSFLLRQQALAEQINSNIPSLNESSF